ncbi:MAG TPA: tetratricopeptide repeat-containing sensor histidine kinase [Pontibacter sp.]
MLPVLLLQFILLIVVPDLQGATSAYTASGQAGAAQHRKAEALYNQSKAQWYTNPKQAVAYGKEAIKLAGELNDSSLLAKAYNSTGAGYYYLGDYNTATEYYYNATKIRELLADTAGLSASFGNIGNIYNKQQNYSSALKYYSKALLLARQSNDTLAISRAYNNMGNAYEGLKKYNTALYYYLQALPVTEKLKDEKGTTITLINLGYTYQKQGRYTDALHYLQRGLALTNKTNNLHDRIYAYRGLAETYQGMRDTAKAILFAEMSLELAQQVQAKGEIKTSAGVIHRICSEAGDFERAYQYLQLYSAYNDSISSETITRQTTSFQVKYETAQKEKENLRLLAEHELHEQELVHKTIIQYATIALLALALTVVVLIYRGNQRMKRMNMLLSRKNRKVSRFSENIKTQKNVLAAQALELHQQKEELEKLNQVKDKLFSLVAHDLRGPLLSLKSLLELLAMGRIPEEKFLHFAKVLESEQQNTLWLVDNLMLWATSQMQGTSVKPQPVDIRELAEENIKLLQPQAARKGISLSSQVQHEALAYADTDMIRLVIRNLISNAIKFCSKGDLVTIETEPGPDETLQITVRDTGIGISEENQKRLFGLRSFTTLGTAREKGSGLGLALCKSSVELNGGKIWVESTPGQGCTFTFTLPVMPDAIVDVQEKELQTADLI